VELARSAAASSIFHPPSAPQHSVALSERLPRHSFAGRASGETVRVRAIISDTDLVFEVFDEAWIRRDGDTDCTTEENSAKRKSRVF